MSIRLKSVYQKPDPADGIRVLAETFWPMERQSPDLMPYVWVRAVAPSYNLTERLRLDNWDWARFRDAYLEELRHPYKRAQLRKLREAAKSGVVTLLHSTRFAEGSSAAVLREVLAHSR